MVILIRNYLKTQMSAKHSFHPADRLREQVNFFLRIIKGKRSPYGAGYPKMVDQWLGTVVPGPHCNTHLIDYGSCIKRMYIPYQE
jgi:hypothetical protein